MKFILNGCEIIENDNVEQNLLSYLRLEHNITSPKDGCSGEGICGCCTILINGLPRLACRTKLKEVENKSILTIEGLEKKLQNILADAFISEGGIQCGFCTPGIVIRATALLLKNNNPTAQEIKQILAGHLCRCTGYKKIISSILVAAKALRENIEINIEKNANIGSKYPKYLAKEAVLGKRLFVADMKKDNMLHGVLLFSKYPRAKILKINTQKAEMFSGVIKIIKAENVIGQRYIGLIYEDWPLYVATNEITRYIGDVLCCIIAKNEQIARNALKLVEVEYEQLEGIYDINSALNNKDIYITEKGNILYKSHIKNGDAEDILMKSKYKTKGIYKTQRIEHAFLETEACLAMPIEINNQKGLKVFSQGQGAYEDRKQIAKILNLPEKLVNVIQVQNGGAFGGKEDLTVQGHASLAAWICNAPVKICLTREESMRYHPKRHPFEMHYEVGANEQGQLTAIKARLFCDSGAYASVGMKVVERAVAHATSAYEVPIVDIEGTALITNNVPCGAMRGFGVNQAAFAMEQCIEELCSMASFDRWQFRYDNALAEGKKVCTGQVLKKGVGVRDCLNILKDKFYKAKYAGLAVGIKNTGIGCGMSDIGRAKIEIVASNLVKIHHGWTEMGQGVHNMALQTVVEETGINPEIIEVVVDTSADTVCGMTTSSRGTSLVAHSLLKATQQLKMDLQTKNLDELINNIYYGEWVCDFTTKIGDLTTNKEICSHYSYSYAAQLVELNEQGQISKITAVHDAGKIMNKMLFEGQIEGALHMGLGYALKENFPSTNGIPHSFKLKDCQILRAHEMPEIEVIGVECHDPNGPYGAKGVGEIGLVPTAAAVAAAYRQFDGCTRYELPLMGIPLN